MRKGRIIPSRRDTSILLMVFLGSNTLLLSGPNLQPAVPPATPFPALHSFQSWLALDTVFLPPYKRHYPALEIPL